MSERPSDLAYLNVYRGNPRAGSVLSPTLQIKEAAFAGCKEARDRRSARNSVVGPPLLEV